MIRRIYHPIPIEHINERKFWRWGNKTESCWLWLRRGGTGQKATYGLFDMQVPTPWGSATLRQSAHRVAYAIAKGQIPDGLEVMHLCNTPRCVRPDHLELGTPAENSAYKVLHGRQARGGKTLGGGGRTTKLWRRLTEQEVVDIRRSYAERKQHYSDLARQYGVHWKTIAAIVHRTSWKHIPINGTPILKSGLSQEEVTRLKQTPLNGKSLSELAESFGVTKPAILHVVQKKAWKHI